MSGPRVLDALRALRAPLVALCTVLMLAGALVGGGARAADGTLGAWCIGSAFPADPSRRGRPGHRERRGLPLLHRPRRDAWRSGLRALARTVRHHRGPCRGTRTRAEKARQRPRQPRPRPAALLNDPPPRTTDAFPRRRAPDSSLQETTHDRDHEGWRPAAGTPAHQPAHEPPHPTCDRTGTRRARPPPSLGARIRSRRARGVAGARRQHLQGRHAHRPRLRRRGDPHAHHRPARGFCRREADAQGRLDRRDRERSL